MDWPTSSCLGLQDRDPRAKLFLLLLAVATVFTCRSFVPLVWLSLPLWLMLWYCPDWRRGLWRQLRCFRWLFILTPVLHLFLTPGRVLLGVSWLSADGLVRGLLVDVQWILAFSLTQLLTQSTSPPMLLAALRRMPLRRKCAEKQWADTLAALVIYFLPRVVSYGPEMVQQVGQTAGGSWTERARQAGQWLAALMAQMIDDAEQLAQQLHQGASLPGQLQAEVQLAWRRQDSLLLLAGALFLLCGLRL